MKLIGLAERLRRVRRWEEHSDVLSMERSFCTSFCLNTVVRAIVLNV